MKKSILAVAGVAAFAGVAMPVAGAFAADASDSISVTVGDNCSFAKTAPGTYSKSNMAVKALEEFENNSSTYTAVCNNSKGYTVTASFVDMKSPDTTDTIPYYTATDPAVGISVWGAYIDNGTTPVMTGTVVKSSTKATTAAGETFTTKYKVSTDDVQEQGTYTGTATYTFAEKTSA